MPLGEIKAKGRIARVRAYLPQLTQIARSIHSDEGMAQAAILFAWAALAGVSGCTPEMKAETERQFKDGKDNLQCR